MKKLFKLVALVSLMTILFATPIMAAEQEQETVVKEDEAVNTAETRVGQLVGTFTTPGKVYLSQGRTVGTAHIAGNHVIRTVKCKVSGPGSVIFNFKDPVSGDSRSFTTASDGAWHSITYVSPLNVSDELVISAGWISTSGNYSATFEFYN